MDNARNTQHTSRHLISLSWKPSYFFLNFIAVSNFKTWLSFEDDYSVERDTSETPVLLNHRLLQDCRRISPA